MVPGKQKVQFWKRFSWKLLWIFQTVWTSLSTFGTCFYHFNLREGILYFWAKINASSMLDWILIDWN